MTKTLDISTVAADPVISEVRRAKTAVAQKYGFDVIAMVRGLRQIDEEENENKTVDSTPAAPCFVASLPAGVAPTGNRESPLTFDGKYSLCPIFRIDLLKERQARVDRGEAQLLDWDKVKFPIGRG